MGKLGSKTERAKHVKKFVDRARDEKTGRLHVNWAHLLLAAMVEKGYINRILTTNFDPLIVEALALSGQPIQTYDLNTTGKYYPGTLDPASVIYLHGQMHSLFLANSQEEVNRLKVHYPDVLREAVQNSFLIVVGYSGDCDPVLDCLRALRSFPRGLWWSHYSPSGNPVGEGVKRLFEKFGGDCHLAEGHDADTFMRKMVLDGMQVDLPEKVLKPITALRQELERITEYPTDGPEAGDPLKTAIERVKRCEEWDAKFKVESQIEMAAMVGDWEKFDELRENIEPDPNASLSRVVGDALLGRASLLLQQGNPDEGILYLRELESCGLKEENKSWLPTVWGTALSAQANLKGNTPEGDRLFAEAGEKYAEAVRIKPDMHEAFSNWGNALSDQAKLKGNTAEGEQFFAQAGEKYAEALRIKPDMHEAYFNLGCLFAIRGDSAKAVAHLETWQKHCPTASQAKIDKDSDFDPIRDSAEFRKFRDSLPPNTGTPILVGHPCRE